MYDTVENEVDSYLKLPYARLVVPETDGTFRAEILEFPGCIALGDSPSAALLSVEEVARDWLAVALANGQSIPAPVDNTEFSGRVVVRMPKSLHKKLSRVAEHERVSLNQFIVAALAERVGERAKLFSVTIVNTASYIGNSVSRRIERFTPFSFNKNFTLNTGPNTLMLETERPQVALPLDHISRG